MKLTPEELKLVNDWESVRFAFVEAKRRVASGELSRSSIQYQEAKAAMNNARTEWRKIGEYVGTRTPVAPIQATGG